MFDEMYFLFNLENPTANSRNGGGTVTSAKNPALSYNKTLMYDKGDGTPGSDSFNINGFAITNTELKDNFIKSKVNSAYETSGKNPYMKLLEDFDGSKNKSLKLKSSDFVYLRDIGVYPINRLMILRRFAKDCLVPHDLNDMNSEPISTMVGWVKHDADFLNFSVGETWVQQGPDKMLHLLLADIIKSEFGPDITKVVPTTGWGVGFVFGFLNKMKLTNFSQTNIPLNNPNVLRESITRPFDEFGLKSNWSFTFETVYEQKYIGGIDSTVSIMDILQNCLNMGTTNVEYIGRSDSEILKTLMAANNDPTNPSAWITFLTSCMKSFVSAVQQTINQVVATLKKTISDASNKADASVQKEKDQQKEIDNLNKDDEKYEEKKKALEKKFADEKALGVQGAAMNIMDSVIDNLATPFMESVLASTVARYYWPLRGSVAMLTGQAATPWHITIGNPYAPLLSMNNIYVENVAIVSTGEMMYNDIPKFLKVTVTLKQGRNMGKQEVYNVFGVEYHRTYKKIGVK